VPPELPHFLDGGASTSGSRVSPRMQGPYGVGHSPFRGRRHIRTVAAKNQPEFLKELARIADSGV
jgi:hypothetical protein